jgi:hypothetical protein
MRRREFIHTGSGGAILLSLAGCAPAAGDDRETMLRAIAGAILDGALPGDSRREAALETAVNGVEVAISGLPVMVQREVAQLFALLQVPLTRAFVAGVRAPWKESSPQDVAAFLERWRTSNTLLFRSGYQALHQLVLAGWYGGDLAWQATGYPGPPSIT